MKGGTQNTNRHTPPIRFKSGGEDEAPAVLTFPYFLYTLERQKKKGKRTAAKEKRTAARGKEQEKNRKKKDRGP